MNEGDIEIENLDGRLIADNINGGIYISKAKGMVSSNTINGDITVDFLNNPESGSLFKTINGDINTNIKGDLSAVVSFKSMNGDFFTDFDFATNESGRLIKNDDEDEFVYRLEQLNRVTIGSGESDLYYETLNGNMYLRKLN